MAIAPTHSNLLKLKKELGIAREGYSLLDEKREVMIMELMDSIHGFKGMEEDLTEKLKEAYIALEDAVVSMGKDNLRKFSKTKEQPYVDIRMRSIMGIPIPELMIDIPEEGCYASLESTDENFDLALMNFKEVLEIAVQWAAREVLLWRLGSEINKTQKRVNALENLFIPEYEEDIKRIEESLEEEEREEFFRRKRLKGRGY